MKKSYHTQIERRDKMTSVSSDDGEIMNRVHVISIHGRESSSARDCAQKVLEEAYLILVDRLSSLTDGYTLTDSCYLYTDANRGCLHLRVPSEDVSGPMEALKDIRDNLVCGIKSLRDIDGLAGGEEISTLLQSLTRQHDDVCRLIEELK